MFAPINKVARLLLGEPNVQLSTDSEYRYRARGSLSVDVVRNQFYDHEAGVGGGVISFVEHIKRCPRDFAKEWLEINFPHISDEIPRSRRARVTEQKNSAAYGLKVWCRASGGNRQIATHPYAFSKGITWEAGVRRGRASGRVIGQDVDCIVVPIRNIDTWRVVAVQCINANGKKQTFGSLAGAAFVCGNTKGPVHRWFIVEGWADAISIVFHHYHGNAAAFAACGKSSMAKLADCVARVYSPDELIVLEDAD